MDVITRERMSTLILDTVINKISQKYLTTLNIFLRYYCVYHKIHQTKPQQQPTSLKNMNAYLTLVLLTNILAILHSGLAYESENMVATARTRDFKEPKTRYLAKKTNAPKAPKATKEPNAPKQTKVPNLRNLEKKTKLPKATKEPNAPKQTKLPKTRNLIKKTKAPKATKEPKAPKAPKATKEPKTPKQTKVPNLPDLA